MKRYYFNLELGFLGETIDDKLICAKEWSYFIENENKINDIEISKDKIYLLNEENIEMQYSDTMKKYEKSLENIVAIEQQQSKILEKINTVHLNIDILSEQEYSWEEINKVIKKLNNPLQEELGLIEKSLSYYKSELENKKNGLKCMRDLMIKFLIKNGGKNNV